MRPGRILGGAAALGLAFAVAACGFHPMYGTERDEVAPAQLAAISIQPIPDRAGQILRNDLLDRLTPHGVLDRPRYVLRVRLQESKRELAIRPDETATRVELDFTAPYALYTADRHALVVSGAVTTRVSYDILLQEYATLSAEMDARRQAMRDLSERIRTRLSIALSESAARARP